MPSVNMIAPRRAEKLRLERDMRRLVIVIIAELVIAAGLGGWVCTKLWTTNGRIADLNVQLTKLQPIVKEIKQYEQASAKLDPKLKLLGQAKDGTMRWFNTLDRLSASLPDSTYLTRVSTVISPDSKNQSTVSLNGVSSSQAKVGEIMLRINSIPDFRSVDLHFTQKTLVGVNTAVEFEIGAQLKDNGSSGEVKKNGTVQS